MIDQASGRDGRAIHRLPQPHNADGPFLRAPEGARTVFLVTLFAACGPLAGGVVLFGWRAAVVAALSMVSCGLIEKVYFRVTRTPALLGRTHGVLTGLLLALTLPAFVPWYVPVVAAAFAIIVGKAVFGGVGHFLWQPALVGRLAVAALFPAQLTVASSMLSTRQPVLAQNRLLVGDVRSAGYGRDSLSWRGRGAPDGKDAFLLTPPRKLLAPLTDRHDPGFGALVYRRADAPGGRPAALLHMPPVVNLLLGARPGGIGETCAILLLVAGLYLIYRNYLKWQLPLAFIAAAWCTVAVAPIYLIGPNETVEAHWLPLMTAEGAGAAFTYVNYQLLSGELMLAVLLVGCEMTGRPVTTGGQVLFGLGCGTGAMLLQLYMNVPIPCYMAVLAMNTLTPMIDGLWRPRVFGTPRLAWLRRRR
jgi:electron transport complex protein RnfD